jgi:hypothetical protein
LALSFVFFYSCSDDTNEEEPTPQLTYNIQNFANGAVATQNDTGDTESLGVAQPIPALNSPEAYPVNMPVIIFFNDKLYLNSLEDNFTVTNNGNIVGGNISIGEASNGFAVLMFTPYDPYTPNSQVSVELKANIQDDGGNGLDADFVLSFEVSNFSSGSFDSNSSFENVNDGILFVGDGAVATAPIGCLSATDGNNYALISSGDALVSSDSAVGNASSLAILGPINSNISSVTFNYNFLSAEFQEYVGSQFDDSFVATVVGPNGAYVEVVNTVNLVGNNNTECLGFPNFPDNGDSYAGETGWITETLNFAQVGSPAYIIFTVTDVSDTIFSSIVSLDEVNFN